MNHARTLRRVLLWLCSLALFFVSGGAALAAPHAALCTVGVCADHLPALIHAPFSLHVNFTEPAASFTAAHVDVQNATISNVATSTEDETNFTFLVTPVIDGPVSVVIDNGAVLGVDGAPGVASNSITTTYDATPPAIIGTPANMTLEATGANGAVAAYVNPTATDANNIQTFSCDHASGDVFAFGTTTVTCTAFDNAGNIASSSFDIGVIDTTPPTLGGHVDISLQATTTSGTIVTYTLPAATDAVDGAVGVSCAPASNTLFALGDTRVVCTADPDAHGNATGSISFLIHVAAPGSTDDAIATATTTASDGSVVGNIADGLSASAMTEVGQVTAALFPGTNVSGTSAWDGTLALPATTTVFAQPVPDAGNTVSSVVSAIELGASTPLLLDHAARIAFEGQAGASVGWSRGGIFTPITTLCSGDSQDAGDALPVGSDCKIDSAGDLVVWTKHFTTFVTYTQAAIPPPSSSGGGGGSSPSPSSSSGGGGGIVIPPAATTTASVVMQTPATSSQQILGASAYNFTLYLKQGSRGVEVLELQKLLVADGLLAAKPTGYYGAMTAAAVSALQASHGITPQTGTVGPLTRTLLNAGASGQVLGASTFNFTNDLTLGATSTDVVELQKILMSANLLKSTLPLGYYGMYTALAVSAYQKVHGVSISGIVDSATRALLNKGSI